MSLACLSRSLSCILWFWASWQVCQNATTILLQRNLAQNFIERTINFFSNYLSYSGSFKLAANYWSHILHTNFHSFLWLNGDNPARLAQLPSLASTSIALWSIAIEVTLHGFFEQSHRTSECVCTHLWQVFGWEKTRRLSSAHPPGGIEASC